MRREFSVSAPDGKGITLGLRTIVVGVLNVTPDSFSDGGQHFDSGRAIERALEMESEGADIIEVGGESTRPGAARLSAEDEIARVDPVLKALSVQLKVPISIDTYKSEVARIAVESGAAIINDVSALRFDPVIADVAAQTGAALVLMHMRGDPVTMQKLPTSTNIFADINADLNKAIEQALTRGVKRDQLVIDPGVGFGKSLEDNLAIINHLDRLANLDMPLMIGTSRKSFIGRLTGKPVDDRVFGTAATAAIAISRGAHILRVHDVKEMVEVARVTDSIIAATESLQG